MSFASKVVIITGASAGIGAATAISVAKEGANVVLVGRNEARLKEVAAECSKFGKKQLPIAADVAKDDDLQRIVDDTITIFGKLDVLVNNAGMAVVGTLIDGNYTEAFDAMMKVNVRAVIQLTTFAAPHLAKSKGHIVNISSAAGKHVSLQCAGYNVTKAALDHFTRGAALELASLGVRVNGVSPGPVHTGFFDTNKLPVNADTVAPFTALKRASEPEEIADLILYLASDKAKGITGSDYVVDNGILLK